MFYLCITGCLTEMGGRPLEHLVEAKSAEGAKYLGEGWWQSNRNPRPKVWVIPVSAYATKGKVELVFNKTWIMENGVAEIMFITGFIFREVAVRWVWERERNDLLSPKEGQERIFVGWGYPDRYIGILEAIEAMLESVSS